MKKLIAIAFFLLLAAPLHAGMLTGQTPANVSIPSGWSLVRAQDFEGIRPAGETWGSWNGVVNTVRPHTGTKSIEGSYANNQADAHWTLASGYSGSFTEIYVSFYEYIESSARFNDEFFLANFYRSGPFQEVVLDWFWAHTFNDTGAELYIVPQGVKYGNQGGQYRTVPTGSWVQWEIHYRPNIGDTPNGFYRVYLNGALILSAENQNFNGTADMRNCSVQVGGVYTKNVWMTDYPTCETCGTSIGNGTDYCTSLFSNAFNDQRCPPNVPNFKRYFDDIIVMTTGGVSGGDVSPPYTNTNSPAKYSTGWPVASRNVTLYVRDDVNVVRSSIGMTIDGATVTPTITPSTTPSTAYYLSYTRGSDWADNTLYTVGVTAQDTSGNALNETYTFRTELASPEALAITTTTLPDGQVGVAYSQTLAATGGVSPYTWDNTTVLPAGLSVSPNTGVVLGTPTTAGGPTSVTFRVTDSASTTDTQAIDMTIDPADEYPTGEIHDVDDTYLNVGGLTQNYSTGDELYLYTWPTDNVANTVLMKWDLSSVAGTVPTAATLMIYMTGHDGAGGDNAYLATVHRVTGVDPVISAASWATYDGVNAWTGGADGGASDIGDSEASFSIDKTSKYYSIDVTQMVRDWLLDPSSNKGMMILPPSTATVDTNRHFASFENPTAAFRPVLFLTYVPVPSPIQSLTVGTLTGGIIE